jgi:hypothetical protein
MLEQREANAATALWRLWPCAQPSVEPAATITHAWAAAQGIAPGLGVAPYMGSLFSFHFLSPPPDRITDLGHTANDRLAALVHMNMIHGDLLLRCLSPQAGKSLQLFVEMLLPFPIEKIAGTLAGRMARFSSHAGYGRATL